MRRAGINLTPEQTVRVASAYYPHTLAEMASEGKWRPYPYLAHLSKLLAEKIRQGGARVIVNIPPRHGKSQLLCRWLPAWYLENWPTGRVIACTHSAPLADEHGRWVRNEVGWNPYFTVKLRNDSKAADRWNTPEGGGMLCAGVGKGIMGFGGNVLLLDDPYPGWAEAYSSTYRRNLMDWFEASFTTRTEPDASIIILHQRMHPDDLSGVLLREEPEKWTHICLPAVAGMNDPMGRAPGEPLCPERYDAAALEQKRLAERGGDVKWQAMYQQSPRRLASGAVFSRFKQHHVDASVGWQPNLPLQISFDFNINPGMHIELGHYNPTTDQFTTVDEIYAPRLDLIASLRRVEQFVKMHPWPEVHVYGDATGNSANAQTGRSQYAIISEWMQRSGIKGRIRTPKANPPVVDRIAAMNDALEDVAGQTHYRIHPRCQVLIADFENLRMEADGSVDKSDPMRGHMSDACSYRVCYQRSAGRFKRPTEARFSVR